AKAALPKTQASATKSISLPAQRRTFSAKRLPSFRLPDADELFSSQKRRMFLLGAAAMVLVGTTLMIPWMRTRAHEETQAPAKSAFLTGSKIPGLSPGTELQRLRELAEAGDDNAQFALGARYAYGDGVPQDYGIACRWFSLAADQGHVVAQATLGA